MKGRTSLHRAYALGLATWLSSAGSSCHDEARRLSERDEANVMTTGPELASTVPGPPAPPRSPDPEPLRSPDLGPLYANNAWAISEGKRLFSWYNCSGCHGRGGGGMGPALMDDRWLYGDRLEQIFASIAGGRPNGMPAWGTRLNEAQIWQLVAFVRSLSGNVTKSAISPRADEISYRTETREAHAPPPESVR